MDKGIKRRKLQWLRYTISKPIKTPCYTAFYWIPNGRRLRGGKECCRAVRVYPEPKIMNENFYPGHI